MVKPTYFPYLRGKQFELILLRENAELLAKSNIIPIIEPVKSKFNGLVRTVNALEENEAQCVLIVNPQAGESPVESDDILDELIDGEFKGFKNVAIGYMLHPKSRKAGLLNLLKKHPDNSFSVIHYGFTEGKSLSESISKYKNIERHIFIDGKSGGKLYQRNFKNGDSIRVLVRDGFKHQQKNAFYPPTEHFSDLHITFEDEGMDGFGDFLMVGKEYSETGGPAYAVAIHLTYLQSDEDMHIFHFVSDQTDSPVDPGGKFLEALKKLNAELNKNNSRLTMTGACEEFQDLYNKQHFPGLGYVKKLSMQHHIELIADYQSRS